MVDFRGEALATAFWVVRVAENRHLGAHGLLYGVHRTYIMLMTLLGLVALEESRKVAECLLLLYFVVDGDERGESFQLCNFVRQLKAHASCLGVANWP